MSDVMMQMHADSAQEMFAMLRTLSGYRTPRTLTTGQFCYFISAPSQKSVPQPHWRTFSLVGCGMMMKYVVSKV